MTLCCLKDLIINTEFINILFFCKDENIPKKKKKKIYKRTEVHCTMRHINKNRIKLILVVWITKLHFFEQ